MAQDYATNDGPFGKVPEISIGASDALLVTISLGGFCLLAWSLYSIVLTKLKTASELQEEEEEISYDERLAKADVATLNRAQRRARAKHIMKQQRKIDQEQSPLDQEIPPFRRNHHNEGTLLSRKERQKAAKQIELQERKVLEESRRIEQRKNQEDAMRKRKEKEQRKALQAEQEKAFKELHQQEQEKEAYKAWMTFLEGAGNTLTVKEWIHELQGDRWVRLDSLANRFRIEERKVLDRIRTLIETSRISGFLQCEGPTEQWMFCYIAPQEMASLASFLQTRDKWTPNDLAHKMEEELLLQ